jgi:hypothetical protein
MVRTRRWLAAVAMAASVAVGFAGCGGDGSTDRRAAESPPVLTATVPPSTSTSTSTGSGGGPSTGGVPGAIDTTDPQGTYTMQISPDWVDASGALVKEIESWYVSPADGTFRNNVNVLTQDTQGMDLQEYMDYSASHLGGLELLSSRVVTGAFGQELGILDYSGILPGAPVPLHALATVAVAGGEAAVATLTTTLDTFAGERAANERYLLTLEKTGRGSSGSGAATSPGLGTA